VIAAGVLLDGADASLDFWNVLIFAGNIEGCMEAGSDVVAAALKLYIRVNLVDFETTLEVCLVHVTNTFNKDWHCAIGERSGRDGKHITGDGHEEASFVDGQIVDAQSD
jgi:hypothetical protein